MANQETYPCLYTSHLQTLYTHLFTILLVIFSPLQSPPNCPNWSLGITAMATPPPCDSDQALQLAAGQEHCIMGRSYMLPHTLKPWVFCSCSQGERNSKAVLRRQV